MNKKALDRKKIQAIVEDEINSGKPKSQILNELSDKYYDKKTLATIIASTVGEETKEEYKLLNNILLGLLLSIIIFKIGIGLFALSNISIFLSPLALLFPFLTILFAVEVAKFRGHAYRLIVLLSAVGVLQALANISKAGLWVLVDIIIAIIIGALSFYLGKKMFPHYDLFGPKKDDNGNFIMER
jgi:hypothetical protein